MKRIGERIKSKREQMSLQLNELAKKVGVSSSALSQIEKAKSYPTIITLKLIAESLHTTVGELIGENESLVNNPVFRHEEAVVMDTNESGSQTFNLSQHDLSKQLETFLLLLPENGNSLDLFKHFNGQIFAYLQSGEIQFDIDNKSYVIQAGDTLYFNAKRNFFIQNLFNTTSELVCVAINSQK